MRSLNHLLSVSKRLFTAVSQRIGVKAICKRKQLELQVCGLRVDVALKLP